MIINLPHKPVHSVEWLEDFFAKNYYKKPYDRFSWWRKYTSINKPLSKRSPLRDRILNGDFDIGSYSFEAELVEHTINDKFIKNYNDQGKFVEETSLDRARRKRLLEDFKKDESRKLEELVKSFRDLLPITEEEIWEELANYNDTLIEFYYYITEKNPRKNKIPY